jgi:hypothetical protein
MIYGALGYLLGIVIALAYLKYKDKLVEWLDKKIKIVKE